MIDWLGQVGSGLAASALSLAILVGAYWLADKTIRLLFPRHDAFSDNKGCLLMLAFGALYFLLLGLLFYPAVDALKRHACKGADDFEICMDGGEDY